MAVWYDLRMAEDSIRLFGDTFSPYSMKLRALMRYRRIPYLWLSYDGVGAPPAPEVPVALIPILQFPGEEKGMIDTTFQLRRLERDFPDPARSVIPEDPVVALLDALIEDFADEWLTKAMFHYRWSFEADADKAARILPYGHVARSDEATMREQAERIGGRQISRLAVVGSSRETAPLIEQSYRRLLRLLGARLEQSQYVMGERPGTADFALYGQLSQLALFEQTAMAVAYEESPRVIAWCYWMDDLSGAPGGASWLSREAAASGLRPILEEVGRTYAPFLIANAAALQAGRPRVECQIDGAKWVQDAFPYQGKCLVWLREQYAGLDAEARSAADAILAGTGCEALFA